MALQRINLGGQQRPILFGHGAFAIFQAKTGCDIRKFIRDFSEMNPISVEFIALVSAGLENGCTYEGVSFDATDKQVGAWIDVYGQSIEDVILRMVAHAMGLDLDVPDVPAKKKATNPNPGTETAALR